MIGTGTVYRTMEMDIMGALSSECLEQGLKVRLQEHTVRLIDSSTAIIKIKNVSRGVNCCRR